MMNGEQQSMWLMKRRGKISPAQQQKKLNVVRKSDESHVGISILYETCWVRKRLVRQKS